MSEVQQPVPGRIDKFAPLPDAAKGPDIPDAGYLTLEIGDGLYVVTEGAFQMMFLVGHDDVIAVDAPQTLGQHILPAISAVTSKPIRHVVYSHHHADHIGAATVYPDDAARYAHRDAAARLARHGDPNRPAPTVLVDDAYTLAVPGQTLQLEYLGPNHSPGNLFLHAPAQRVLMLVDVIFPGWVPFASLGYAADIPGFVAAHDQVLDYDFTTFVGGHLGRTGTRNDVVVQREYIADLRSAVEDSFSHLDLQAVYGSVDDPANLWSFFSAFADTVTDAATGQVVPRWTRRLGGADVYTRSNVAVLAESLRIDYGALG